MQTQVVQAVTDTKLISPVFALASGLSSATLSFEHFYQYFSSDVTVQNCQQMAALLIL